MGAAEPRARAPVSRAVWLPCPRSGYTLVMAPSQDRELEYYRSIEDYFATLRGVPHTLSPKDFQLLREWWADQIPLSAVRTGMTEAFAKRRDRGETEPIVSLSYCRHAVRAHARRIAEMQIGAADESVLDDTVDRNEQLRGLADRLRESARKYRTENPRLFDLLTGIAETIVAAPEMPATAFEEHLFALESTLLSNCFEFLDESQRRDIEDRARTAASSSTATPEAQERAYRAHRDRLLRHVLALPRLEFE